MRTSRLIFPRDRWQRRAIRWHFHERICSVHLGNDDPPAAADDGFPIVVRLPWGSPRAFPGAHTILPAPLEPGEEHFELAACARARERSWPAAAARRIESRLEERLALFRGQIRGSYLDGSVVGRGGETQRAPRPEGALTFSGWFDACFEGILRRAYPAFERFAPSHGPLAKEVYKGFLRFAAQHDLGDAGSR